MTKPKLSFAIDFIFSNIFLFLMFFCWLKFYTKNTSLSCLFSAILTILVITIFFKIKNKRNKKLNITKQDKQNAKFCALQFSFMTSTQVINYFSTILSRNFKPECYNNFITFNQTPTTKTLFMPIYCKNTINETDIANIFAIANQQNCNEVIVSANKIETPALALATKINNIKFTIWDHFSTYLNIIKNNQLPPKVVDTSVEKLTGKQLLLYAFSKNRIKNYLIFGLILLSSSFFVYHKLFYLISGSILIAISITILFLPHNKKNVSKI